MYQEEEARLKALHGDRIVVAGVEKVERLKGVWLKMLAFENMLKDHPELVGRWAVDDMTWLDLIIECTGSSWVLPFHEPVAPVARLLSSNLEGWSFPRSCPSAERDHVAGSL